MSEAERGRSCAFTGHRPERFLFGYNEETALCGQIKAALLEQARRHCEAGVRTFWVGGALGVDMWAAEAVLKLKEEHSDIELHYAIPFKGYVEKWAEESVARLKKSLLQSDGIHLVSHSDALYLETPASLGAAYRKRNQYMVDRCGYLIAVYDRDREMRSGTRMTVNYAQAQKLKITYIHPETAEVTVS